MSDNGMDCIQDVTYLETVYYAVLTIVQAQEEDGHMVYFARPPRVEMKMERTQELPSTPLPSWPRRQSQVFPWANEDAKEPHLQGLRDGGSGDSEGRKGRDGCRLR
jgi:hypothetical protein